MDKTYFSMTRVVFLLTFVCSVIFNQAKAATYTVTDGFNDTYSSVDPNTFEWALAQCNATAGPHTIAFAVISVTVQNPALAVLTRSAVTIDGTTAPGYVAGSPTLVIAGPGWGSLSWSTVSNVTMKALVFNNFMVSISGGSSNTIQSCRFNMNAAGTSAVANGCPSSISASSTTSLTIGGATVASRNIFAWGVTKVINLTSCTTVSVQNNYIGSNATGTTILGTTGDYGVFVDGSSSVTIDNNTIIGCPNTSDAASTGSGILATNTVNNFVVTNNNLGANSSGVGVLNLGNNKAGLYVTATSSNSITVTGNVVCNNGKAQPQANNSGLYFEPTGVITTLNIANNKVGVDINNAAMGNDFAGIYLNCASSSNFYPSVQITNNVVGANGNGNAQKSHGIAFWNVGTSASPANVVVKGNYIGITPTGGDVGNYHNGIEIRASSGITIGGANVADRNYISFNKGANLAASYPMAGGILLTTNATNVTIQGNYIGTGIDAATNAGQASFSGSSALNNGIVIENSSKVVIGGTNTGEGNVIGYNAGNGILVIDGSDRVQIRRNSIFCNGAMGISLNLADATQQIASKTPGNSSLAAPVITSKSAGAIAGTASPNATIEIFNSSTSLCARTCSATLKLQGYTYVATVTANGSGNWSYTGALGSEPTVTQTVLVSGSDYRTSEFGTCSILCVPPAQPTVSVSSASVCQGTTGIVFTVTNPEGGATFTWTVGAGLTVTSGGGTNTTNTSVTVTAPTPSGNSQVYTVSVTSSNGCVSPSGSNTVTVYKTPSTSAAGPDQNLCNVTSATLAATAPTVGTGAWTQTGGPASTITTASSASSTVTGLTSGATSNAYTYLWTVSNGACPASTNDVIVTIYAPVTATANNVSVCNTTNNVSILGNAPSPGTGTWTGAGVTFGNANANSTTVSGLSAAPSTKTLTWTVINGPFASGANTCAVAATMTVSNLAPNNANVTTSNGSFCASTVNTATLNATAVSAPQSGVWTVTSQPGGATASFTNASSNSTTANGLTVSGPYTFTWTVTNGGVCTAATSAVTVTIDQAVTSSPSNVTACSSGGVSLSANTPAAGTGTWTTAGGNPTIVSVNNPNSALSGVVAGTFTYTWTVVNGTCNAANNATVSILAPNNANVTTTAGSFCLSSANTATLNATAVSAPQSGAWSVTSQPGGASATFTNATSNSTTANGLTVSGPYTFTWTVSNGGVCTAATSSVVVTMDQAVTAAASDVNVCGTTAAALNATPVSVGTGTWTTGSSLVIDSPNSATSNLSNLSAGSFNFTWTVVNGSCQATANAVVKLDQTVTASVVAPVITACGGTSGSVTLNGNTPGSGQGTWVVLAPGSGTLSDSHNPTSTLSSLAVPSITQLSWTVVNGACNASTTVTVAIQSNPTSVAGSDQNLCQSGGTSANISGSQQVGETGVWSVISGAGTISDINSASTTVTGLAPGGTLVLQWEVTATACSATDIDQITIRLDNTPTATVDADQTQCETAGTTATLNATAGVGAWTVTSGTGTVTSASSANTTITGLTVGATTTVVWTVPSTFGICASATDDVDITVQRTPVSDAGSDFSTCLTSTNLNATAATGGVWTVTAGTGIVADDANPNTSVSNLSTGVNEFTWTVSGLPACSDVATVVQVTNTTADLDVSVTGDADTLCVGTERRATVSVTTNTGSGNYVYYWSDEDGNALFNTTDPIVSFTPGAGVTTYYVVVVDANQVGCAADIDSVKIAAVGEQVLVIPNLMTPNSDDLNDVLLIRDEHGKDILPGSYLQVVNRWGEQVYENESYRNTWKAPNTSDGMYFYYLKAGCGGRVYKGWIHILGNNKP